MNDALDRLTRAGVAIWLDDLSRRRLVTGNLATLVRERQVVGVTTNPTIFQTAVEDGGEEYTEQLAALAGSGADPEQACRELTTADVRAACDVLRTAYDRTGGVDGRVSIEVDPRLADDTEATVAEARELWRIVDRPNLFIKIPATRAGLPAISRCLSEGLSVNVTLIFGLARYAEVIDAFMDGMEQARAAGQELGAIASVASFFVSRMDTEVDRRLDELGTEEAALLRGQAAVANARLAFELFETRLASRRWQALARAGAHPQRPLWASTSVKDERYEDTHYIDLLVTDGVVNTMPEPTLDAVAGHGRITGDTVRPHYEDARRVLANLARLGIGYDDVVATLEREGVAKFVASWNDLLKALSAALGN